MLSSSKLKKKIFMRSTLYCFVLYQELPERNVRFFRKILSHIISAPSGQFCFHIQNSGALRVAVVEVRTLKYQIDLFPNGITFIQNHPECWPNDSEVEKRDIQILY
jgi:hypothetical protein